jgi:hypothetical protein
MSNNNSRLVVLLSESTFKDEENEVPTEKSIISLIATPPIAVIIVSLKTLSLTAS